MAFLNSQTCTLSIVAPHLVVRQHSCCRLVLAESRQLKPTPAEAGGWWRIWSDCNSQIDVPQISSLTGQSEGRGLQIGMNLLAVNSCRLVG